MTGATGGWREVGRHLRAVEGHTGPVPGGTVARHGALRLFGGGGMVAGRAWAVPAHDVPGFRVVGVRSCPSGVARLPPPLVAAAMPVVNIPFKSR